MSQVTFSGQAILLDIEGTTSSISFVYDVMFPYARRELNAYLHEHWREPALREACERIAADAGWDGRSSSGDGELSQQMLADEVNRLMDDDVKSTGLKQLQGLIWRAGFESGELEAHVYDDVVPALRRWTDLGLAIHIYSSGSVQAQQLFFGHTIQGDLLTFFGGHYDTTTGPKQEVESYRCIVESIAAPPEQILFVSDVVAELDAARTAGLSTALIVRPGNPAVASSGGHPRITSFNDLVVDAG